ncbi:6689_t:CDS:2, partial [Racocetra fulgida]
MNDLFIENKSDNEIIVKNAQNNPKCVKNNPNHIYTLYFNSSYEEVLINKFKGQIKYLELLNFLDLKDYSIQIKGCGNENFCLKVIGFSANTKVRFIYDFCEDKELKPIPEQKFNNTKLFSLFVNRLDYIVEFKKFRDDNEKPYRKSSILTESLDPQEESSKRKLSINELNYDSDLYSDDSDYT